MDNKFKNLELIGVFFTFFFANILKFCYAWSNMSVWSIFVSAVNMSIWEYTKILLFPYIAWSIIELSLLRKLSLKKFVISKIIGLYSLAIFNIISISVLRSILNNNMSYIEILIFLASSIIGFLLSYIFSFNININQNLFSLFFFLMLLAISMIISFTVNPPAINLFKDPFSNTYGINTYIS